MHRPHIHISLPCPIVNRVRTSCRAKKRVTHFWPGGGRARPSRAERSRASSRYGGAWTGIGGVGTNSEKSVFPARPEWRRSDAHYVRTRRMISQTGCWGMTGSDGERVRATAREKESDGGREEGRYNMGGDGGAGNISVYCLQKIDY